MNRTSQNGNTRAMKNEVLDKSLDLHLQTKNVRDWIKWGIINLIILLIILNDVNCKCSFEVSKFCYLEYVGIVVTSLNIFVYTMKYLYYKLTFKPVEGTAEQKELLEFDETDNSFITTLHSRVPTSNKPERDDITIISWHSSFNDSNRSMMPTYRSASRLTPPHLNQSSELQNTSWDSSMNLNEDPNVSYRTYLQEEIITEEKELQNYLKEVAEQEQSVSQMHDSRSVYNSQSINSFWNYYNTAANLLKTSLYQLSSSTASASPGKQGERSLQTRSYGFYEFEGLTELLKKIPPAKLSKYVANLRMWISMTILKRLESEIKSIDESFKSRGLIDLKIGGVGLERLKKAAENQHFVSLHVPMLPLIVPFLEMSTNQEYLVQRIKDLSRGSCISDYRWNSGSSYHGLSWDEHLPTDSAIIFHLFCTYMDGQLMPLPQPDIRPFSNTYVITGDKKSAKDILTEVETKNKSKCAILSTNTLKPKFNFVSDGKIHSCSHDHNNLFYVIIQFLIYMRDNHGGLLEGVNLGKSGINILCVIED